MTIQFIKIGTRVKYIGNLKSRYGHFPADTWLEYGAIGTVSEYHIGWKADPALGETVDVDDSATVKWDFGGETLIHADSEGIRWELLKS